MSPFTSVLLSLAFIVHGAAKLYDGQMVTGWGAVAIGVIGLFIDGMVIGAKGR